MCACDNGYSGDGLNCTGIHAFIITYLLDIDACSSKPCHSNATCNNLYIVGKRNYDSNLSIAYCFHKSYISMNA